MKDPNFKISRKQQMLHKVVMINGFPGCGKTMLSPIVSAFDRVEIMQYSYSFEQICHLHFLNRVDNDVAESMIRMNSDLLIYNVSMGRQTNCRPSDLSSIFRHKPLQHIKRMLSEGDRTIPQKIKENKPILHIATHGQLPNHELLFNSLKDKLIFYEVVRHPLYMIIQHEKNSKTHQTSISQGVNYSIDGKEYPFFALGWEHLFDKSNSYEKAIYHMKFYFEYLFSLSDQRIKVFPFEIFVKQPEAYINTIASDFGSPVTRNVKSEMKRQKVPREQLSDGPALEIYKRCGWEPPKFFSEKEELDVRREFVSSNVSRKALSVLDDLSERYISKYLSNYNIQS